LKDRAKLKESERNSSSLKGKHGREIREDMTTRFFNGKWERPVRRESEPPEGRFGDVYKGKDAILEKFRRPNFFHDPAKGGRNHPKTLVPRGAVTDEWTNGAGVFHLQGGVGI